MAGEGVRELIEDLTGDDLHQRERAAELLTEQLDSPMTIDLRVRWLVARRDWCALRDLGAEAVPPLLEVLARSCARTSLREANYQRSGRSADAWRNQILDEMVVRTLAGLGDPGAEEGVIGFLFERNGRIGSAFEPEDGDPGGWGDVLAAPRSPFWFGFRAGSPVLAGWVEALTPLLGEDAEVILTAACYLPMSEELEGERSDRGQAVYRYDGGTSERAVEELCSMKTERATRILRRVAQKKRIRVPVSEEWNDYGGGITSEWWSFSTQRKKARRALEAR